MESPPTFTQLDIALGEVEPVQIQRIAYTSHYGAPGQEGQVCAPDFMATFTQTCQAFAPLTHFLATALGLPW